MNNKIPTDLVLSLERQPDRILELENILNVNLYNSMLFDDLITTLKNENTALENLNIYCKHLGGYENPTVEYLEMIQAIKELGINFFNILRLNRLYQDNVLLYNLLYLSNRTLWLRRTDIKDDDKLLTLRGKEFNRYLVDGKFNVGIFDFIKNYADR